MNELIEELEAKHNAVRAQIEERINRIQNPDDLITPSDSGVEDNDDVKSNTSEVISETSSSRLSFSRLAEVDMDSVLQRATSRLVSKIVSSGKWFSFY